MAARISKKQLILESCEQQRLESVGVRELRRIQDQLRRRLAPVKAPSLSYIASVLREAGLRVDYEDRYADPVIPELYRERLEGVLHFHDLAGTEKAIRTLDAAWRDYRAAGDREGAELARKLALRGRQRAESLAANTRVEAGKRREKREIASWFALWLENPDLFCDWLDLRKRADDFRAAFAQSAHETPDSGGDQAEDVKS
ncbi:MAG TPA: hypothetical protein VGZ29_08375 [Terriglobia bacterium]|nr:hypothetical protein [Terriglobia bacterium]